MEFSRTGARREDAFSAGGGRVVNGHDSRLVSLLAMTVVALAGGSTTAWGQNPNAGCPNGPYTSCIDPVPATYLSGSWIEMLPGGTIPAEWTITANNGAPGSSGNVSGDVRAFSPAPPGYNCPVVTYQVQSNSSFTPSSITSGLEGSTVISWLAFNPTPSTACGGFVPTHSYTLTGTVPNKGNDTASVTWRNYEGGSGSESMETNLVLTPTGETLTLDTQYDPNGWGPAGGYYQTQLYFLQTLQDSASYDPPDPHNNKFQGRQVFEQAGGTSTDGCYNAARAHGITQTPAAFQILGSVWNVGYSSGAGNQYGWDGVGYTTKTIDWYREFLLDSDFPCTASAVQAMVIVGYIPLVGNVQYATHNLKIAIKSKQAKTGVTVTKDSITQTNPY